MQPGPTLVKKCPTCEGLLQEETIASGNTFGATYWTDGKREAPMLPDYPWMVKCPHCEELLWVDELEQVGEFHWGESNPDTKNSLPYLPAGEADYVKALETMVLNHKKEQYLRMRLWWARNDARRKGKSDLPLTDSEIPNLTQLFNLLDANDQNNLVMKAEIKRELGEFAAAQELLDRVQNERLEKVVNFLDGLLQQQNTQVARISFD